MERDWKQKFLALVATQQGRPLLRFFVSRLPNAADAPDLVQEVYIRILRLERPELIRSPEAYLFTIAANIAHEHRLKRFNRPTHIALDDTPEDELLVGGDAANPTPEEVAVQAEGMKRIERTLGQLSPKARAALVWHRRDGLTYEEIGERLGVSRNMVKKYLSQALAHCKKCMDREQAD